MFSLIIQKWFDPDLEPSAAPPPAGVISPGGLHHIEWGMGDTGEGLRVAQTLCTIEEGISA